MDFTHYIREQYLASKCGAVRLELRSKGFSLLEVLISIVVLSFGLLGMLGLQAAALQANRDARMQSAAVNLARELAEMMRNNKTIALDTSSPYFGNFTTPLTAVSPSYCLNVASSTSCGTGTTGLTAIANAEMTEWLSRVDSELPGARVTVCSDSAPFDSTGAPQWTCGTGTDASTVIKIGWTRGSTDHSSTNTTPLDRATKPSIILPVTAGNAL